MFIRDSKPNIDTLIGKAARVQGDVEFEGGLHLDGQVTGNVRAVHGPGSGSTLSVSENGFIEGSVEADNVTLNGTVRGDIYASDRLVLGPRARVQGNVRYGVIEMTLGAEIKGKLMPLPSPVAVPMEGEPAAKSG
ncbi:MAG TPA: polymer-forming cytoskeletal protein [Steroidobacteraceae bacterium]|jgi:cytoskeletal protein CcmA (bactofilin family)|nr:polymer-forming cytoskeletal protein [Steroidobacteraceae bacterium]